MSPTIIDFRQADDARDVVHRVAGQVAVRANLEPGVGVRQLECGAPALIAIYGYPQERAVHRNLDYGISLRIRVVLAVTD